MSDALRFVELASRTDDLLLAWLDLFETAFPPQEKVLVSAHLRLLEAKERGGEPDRTMLAAVDSHKRLVGIAAYEVRRDWAALSLSYLAVSPELRGGGIGAQIYCEIVRRARELGVRAIVFEVEIPEECGDRAGQLLAERRIGFYKRQGARLGTGIRYMQCVGAHQPPIPMHLMVHTLEPLDAQGAFDTAKCLFGEMLSQEGKLELM